MATLSLASCSPGSEITAAWKSAECCWANCFISMATLFWVSVEKRQKKSLRMTYRCFKTKEFGDTVQFIESKQATEKAEIFTFINILVAEDLTGGGNYVLH